MTTTRLPKTITAGALLATPIPPVKWIIPGLLPAGLAIFAGPSKAGKSWLTLWLCLQISQGKSVWGREIEPRTVLYFSLEDTLGRLQERLYKLVDAEEDPERLILQTESHGIGQGLEEQIVSFIHTYPDISLIVIDTLQKVRKSDQNGSMYANDYRDIGAYIISGYSRIKQKLNFLRDSICSLEKTDVEKVRQLMLFAHFLMNRIFQEKEYQKKIFM